jgi:protein-S-isoprenylcysteine O-methyltransferase
VYGEKMDFLKHFHEFQDSILTYDFGIFKGNPQFVERKGLGKIGTTGYLLGLIGGVHFGVLVTSLLIADAYSPRLQYVMVWSAYVCILCFYHFMEFFSTAVNQPSNVTYESYIINQSEAYTLATLASMVEYWLECLIFGPKKFNVYIMLVGALVVVVGQFVRSKGMFDCGEHFNHSIMTQKTDSHKLVTSGIYKYLRHPSYFGWFYWAIGSQLLLCNPFCTVAYTYVSWSFFNTRIPYEESLLIRFYYPQYINYARRTIIGIPFVSSTVSKFAAAMPVGESIPSTPN